MPEPERRGSYTLSLRLLTSLVTVAAAGPSTMPSLFRFIVVVAILGGLGYAAVYALANFVDLKPREITVTIPPDRFLKR